MKRSIFLRDPALVSGPSYAEIDGKPDTGENVSFHRVLKATFCLAKRMHRLPAFHQRGLRQALLSLLPRLISSLCCFKEGENAALLGSMKMQCAKSYTTFSERRRVTSGSASGMLICIHLLLDKYIYIYLKCYISYSFTDVSRQGACSPMCHLKAASKAVPQREGRVVFVFGFSS